MPYKRVGNKIFTKRTGNWNLKQTCSSAENAKKAMGLLQGIEHGNISKMASADEYFLGFYDAIKQVEVIKEFK